MKNRLKFLFILSAVLLFSINVSSQETKSENIKMKVAFHCPNGQKQLETKLKEVKGIESFKIDFETKTIDFKYDPKVITKEGIVEKIEDIGFYTEFSDENKQIKRACNHH